MTAPAARLQNPKGAWARRIRRDRHPWLSAAALGVAAIVLLPVLALAAIALTGGVEEWRYLAATVLPKSGATTLWLLAMVGLASSVTGVVAAWLIVAYDFPLRRTLAWALVLPLAVPPYLAAYAFAEFFLYTGPVQSWLRWAFGFKTIRDYWFPDIRSTGGAALVMASVLYPYVYLTTRIVFLMQGRNIAEVARTLGASPAKVFWRVLLPVARPAIVAGSALVAMETINDIGASEYLGVQTLTVSVYSTWLNRGSLEGGAQIALVTLVLVLFLLVAEERARASQRFHAVRATHLKARPGRIRLGGAWRIAVPVVVCLPVLAGFGIPMLVFGSYAARRLDGALTTELASAFLNSVLTAALTALCAVVLALFLINAVRLSRGPTMRMVVRMASTGYALPGGIVGLGLLFVLARFDNALDAFLRGSFGISTGLLMSGTAAAVVLGCTIRFLALAEGAIRSGLAKLPPNLDEAARSLGRTPFASARAILLPLLKPAILTALVLVFVDTTKELSATILLRPFGFNTLATYVYENASRGVPQDGALAALLIILTALVPVVLLSGALGGDREASL